MSNASYNAIIADTTKLLVDACQVRDGLAAILAGGQVIEVRCLKATTVGDRYPRILSGYFNDPAKVAAELAKLKSARGVYYTPNVINPALMARASNRLQPADKGDSTADHDVLDRRWLLIDADPDRPAGISSSDDEHEAALARCRTIAEDSGNEGWPMPVVADSGNGGHLMYRIDLPADDGGAVAAFLKGLARRYDGNGVKIDLSVHNPARIWKVPGTLACKGDDTPDRPHRRACLINVPAALKVVSLAQMRALAAEVEPATTEAEPAGIAEQRVARPSTGIFDLTEWVRRHGLDVTGPETWQSRAGTGVRYVFKVCPWNAEHTDQSAWVGQMANGALAAGCQHAGFSGKKWADLRAVFDPKGDRPNRTDSKSRGENAVRRATTPVLLNMADVIPQPVSWLWHGRFPLGRLSLLVGVPGAGKSYLTCAMASHVSQGWDWPDGQPCTAGHVLLVTAEDDPVDTVPPAAGRLRGRSGPSHLFDRRPKPRRGNGRGPTNGHSRWLISAISNRPCRRWVIADWSSSTPSVHFLAGGSTLTGITKCGRSWPRWRTSPKSTTSRS